MPRGIYSHRPIPEAVRQKISLANKGKQRTTEQRYRISEGLRNHGVKPPLRQGCHWSEQSREQWSLKQKGKVGHPQPISVRQKLSEFFRGERNPHWQGGLTSLTEAIRHTLEYRLWRTKVFERDSYTCRVCHWRGGRLQPHHIKAFAHYPELRFNVDNGITLCSDCHKDTDNFGGRVLRDMVTSNDKTLYEAMVDNKFYLKLEEGKEGTNHEPM